MEENYGRSWRRWGRSSRLQTPETSSEQINGLVKNLVELCYATLRSVWLLTGSGYSGVCVCVCVCVLNHTLSQTFSESLIVRSISGWNRKWTLAPSVDILMTSCDMIAHAGGVHHGTHITIVTTTEKDRV